MTPEVDFGAAKEEEGIRNTSDIGITSLSWFPGASETTMTLAVGGVSGRVSLYKYVKDSQVFSPITSFPTSVRCSSPVVQLTWAFPVGRMFQLLAVCSKTEIYIIRMNCISPSAHTGEFEFETFLFPRGASSASWSHSSTLLYLVSDDGEKKVTVLQMKDPTDHQTWAPVSR
ncbi:hypothetical protein AGDE_08966 [Angomonas deanei]|nr:hypothetical protein AGDE_08966 [Angomonas deanei]|eukprot:EPY31609.1 hypothetical protein AGDE_08966 [Angomonas deanei]